MKLQKPLVIFDLETTGKNTNTDRIVQIGAIKIQTDGSVEEKMVLINPMMPIPKEASDIHGITDDDVANAPEFRRVARSFHAWLSGADIGGFNSDNYDVPLLIQEFSRAGIVYDVTGVSFIDVLKIERAVNSHRLEETYKRYTGKTLDAAHNALADAKATLSVLQHQFEQNKDMLPEKMDELDVFCQGDQKRVDIAGKLYEKEGEVYWSFGKHQHQRVRETLDYARWVVNADFPENTKQMLRKIIKLNTK